MKLANYDLTNPQIRIIYNDIMNPQLEMSNIAYLVKVKEKIIYFKLEDAWNKVLKNNSALRIQIQKKSKLTQIFRPFEYTTIDFIDEAQVSDLNSYLKEIHSKKIDIYNGHLFYFAFVKFSDGTTGFYMKFHHSIMDGISGALVIEKVLDAYNEKFSSNELLGYVDFIEYEKKYINSKRYETNKNYWMKKFKNIDINTTICDLQKETPYFITRKKYISIPKGQYNKICNFSRENNTSYFKLLSIAMGIYFERVKNENRILIGRAIHNRTKKDYRSIVGMFVSTVPLILEFNPDLNILDTIKGINLEMMSNMRHEKFPYNTLIKLLRQKEESNINSDFINILISENPPISNSSVEILDQFFPKHSTYEMSIVLNPRNKLRDNQMEIAIDYAEGALSQKKVFDFISRLHVIIENLIDNPDSLIKDIEILSKQEKDKILFNFNRTYQEYPKNKLYVEFFEEQVRKTPNKKAVICRDGYLSYNELNERANRLAWTLREYGISRNSIVPIIMERSVEMMVGLFGILKAGGAYLPIDPKFPIDRIKYILDDSSANFVLTKSKYNEKISKNVRKLFLDNLDDYLKINKNPPKINQSYDVCYVIYTSGSTGNPKGVEVRNVSLVNHLIWLDDNYPTTESDIILQKTNYTFDPSVSELFSWVLKGASLYLLKENGEKDPDEIIETINREKITIIRFVPSMLSIFFDNPTLLSNISRIESLKYILVGGEALTKKHIDKLNSLNLKNTELINLYGPTEATIEVTSYNCNCMKSEIGNAISIGKPINNTQILIIDKYGHIAPVGFPGELCILGDGLAKGYLNRPDLTKEKFVDTAFYDGAKMYKTGDLAKWRDDGNIDYLGRIDFQIKIRGFRIELGEIESKFLELKDVELVTIIDKINSSGNKYLAAYYTGVEYSIEKLRKKLGESLPDYMIPSQFIHLSEMPLTISGKINRKALPEIDLKNNLTNENLTGSKIENEIIMIWKEVLERDDVTRDSDFFVLGGDSLDAIRVVGRLSRKFNISVTDMFEQKTVSKLADKIRGDKKSLEKNLSSLEELFQQHEEHRETNYVEKILKHELHKYEKQMSDYIEIKNTQTKKKHQNILLTGATGYLGAHLLYDLLKETDSNIYVIVRGKTQEEAINRLNDKMTFYFEKEYNYEKLKKQMTILCGDISQKELGLDTVSSVALENIDCIINSAANVKHYGRYRDFHAVNVKGVENLLEIAKKNKTTDFYQISTKSVGSGLVPNTEYLVFSEDMVDVGQEINNFYIKTKLEAEKLCLNARSEGINANILRVGNLVFNSENGKFQENIEENAFYSKVKDILSTGVIPRAKNKSTEFSFELSYIDFVSRAIVLLISKGIMDNEIMHVYNPHNVSMYRLGKHLKNSGEDIELLEIDEYFEFIKEHYESSELQENIENLILNMTELSKSSKYVLKSERTNSVLKNLGFEWKKPEIDDIIKMMKYGKDVGFF